MAHLPLVLVAFSILLALGQILGALGWGGWLLDFFCQFPIQIACVQALVFFILVVSFALRARHVMWFPILPLFFSIYLARGDSGFLPPPKSPPSIVPERTLRIVSFNVSSANRNFEETMDYLRSVDPDVFGLIEVNHAWEAALSSQFPQYDRKIIAPETGAFGLGLFSKFPLENARLEFSEVTGIPSIAARFTVQGEDVDVVLTHAYPPISPKLFRERNRQLSAIAARRSEFAQNWIVMGDFNCGPWSPYFRDFVSATGLRDSRAGFGFQASWPTSNPILRVPIDHVFLPRTWRVVRRNIGPAIGSDHFPVVVEVALPDQREAPHRGKKSQ